MTQRPKSYTIASEDFALARAGIERHRAELLAIYEAAIAAKAGLESLDTALQKLNEDERIVQEIAERYTEGVPSPKTAKPRRANVPYTPEEDARILAAVTRAEREQVAKDLGRQPSGVQKRRELLRKKAAEPAVEAAQDEAATEESPGVDSFIKDLSQPKLPDLSRRGKPVPGIPARGVIDSGPLDQRILGPAFASKGSE